MKKPDAIFTADWHLTDRQPPCRTDNYLEASLLKVDQIYDLGMKFNCTIIGAGDLFDKWKNSPYLLSQIFWRIPKSYWIPGNHDEPAHNLERMKESSMFLLETAERISMYDYVAEDSFSPELNVDFFPFGSELTACDHESTEESRSIAVIHEFAYKGRKPFPGATGKVTSIMNKLKGYDVIVCGDNHKPFTHEKDGQLFVNPGSLMRMTADQIKHKPRVYLYYAETNTVEPYYLDIEPGVVVRDHIDLPKERANRIDEFITRLKNNFEISLSYRKNLKKFFDSNKVPKRIHQKVMGTIDESD